MTLLTLSPRYGSDQEKPIASQCSYESGVTFWLAVAKNCSFGLYTFGLSIIGIYPSHSYLPSPMTGTRPLCVLLLGAIPTACQPIFPSLSAQTIFSPGILL